MPFPHPYAELSLMTKAMDIFCVQNMNAGAGLEIELWLWAIQLVFSKFSAFNWGQPS